MTVRQLPQASDAEMALLGSMMIYPSVIDTAIEQGLSTDDFFLDANKQIYQTIYDLHEERIPIDATSLSARLTDLQKLRQVGGMDYLIQLADTAGSSASAAYYIKLIQDKTKLRNLIYTAEQIVSDSFETQHDIDEVMDRAEYELLQVTRNRKSSGFVTAKEAVNQAVENVRKMSENRSPVIGMKTDFTRMDRMTNGLQKGDMIIIAARPSMGKTAFALSLAMNMAECNQLPVAFFSLEMDSSALIRRCLSSKSGINMSKLVSGYGISKQEMNDLIEAADELKQFPIYFNDSSQEVTVGSITSSCRKLQGEHGLGAIIIDYLQLMSSGNRRIENRQQEVSEISRGIKRMAQELQVPVIALSQLSRAAVEGSSKENHSYRI